MMRYLLMAAALAVALGLVLYGCTEEPELLQAPPAPTPGIFKSALDGTETLGDIPVPLKDGTCVTSAGLGLLEASTPGAGVLNVTTPSSPGATVEQVFLYWEGHDLDPGTNMGPTDVLTVESQAVTGTLIGGPSFFYSGYHSATYRAEITSLGLVGPGANSLSISGMDFDKNNGVGIVVICKEVGVPIMDFQMKDGNDLAYHGFEPEDRGHCVKQTFTFDSATFERDAVIDLSASSVENPRPNTLYLWIDGTPHSTFPINSPFADLDQSEWDTYHLPIKVPAGATTVELLPVSEDHGTGLNPASIAWINATLAIQSKVASIGDYVWMDGVCGTGDGCQDATDVPVAGVTVNLYSCDVPASPVFVGTDVTDAAGLYLFEDLVPGDYFVEFILPTGYEFVPQNDCGSIPNNTDSDADQTTGRTMCTTLDPGENDLTWDAGLCSPTASLGDYVWCDDDCDGCQDAEEPPIAGVTVNLYQGCSSSTVFLSTTTNASGGYLFDNLAPGDYVVEFILPSGYAFTMPNSCPSGDDDDSDADQTTGKTSCVTLVSGDADMSWDAGMVPLMGVGDWVWFDTNRDGCQDTNENGIAGVTVHLYHCGNPTPVQTTTTDASGYYQFDNLTPCYEYKLQFTNPATNLRFSPKDACPAGDEKDSDAYPNTGFTDCFSLDPDCGEYDVDGSFDAGFNEPPIGCRVTGGCNDTKAENTAQGAEPGLNVYTCGGQAGAPTALPPQPWGEWTHTQKRGPAGSFTFHAGTASAPPGTEIDWIECMDPDWCVQARHAPAKQIDFAGVGTFKNTKNIPNSIGDHVEVGVTQHWFEVNIDDLGEPGKAGKQDPPTELCDPLGFGRNGGTDLGECDCPDFYRIKIYEGPDDTYPVMYEVYGYINGGNFQIHPLTGRDRKDIDSGGGGNRGRGK